MGRSPGAGRLSDGVLVLFDVPQPYVFIQYPSTKYDDYIARSVPEYTEPVYFATGSARVDADAKARLDKLLDRAVRDITAASREQPPQSRP